MTKVLVTPRSYGKTDPHVFEMLEEAGVEIVRNTTGGILSKQQMKDLIADCDGVILGVDPMDAEVLAEAKNLRAIAKYGVGVDNIDLDECKKRGIRVSRTVGANSNAVADYAVALMLACARRILPIDANCRRGDWSKTTSLDIYGSTVGIIGMGAIGKGVAKRMKGFNARVLGCDVYWDEEFAKAEGIEHQELEYIYKNSDFITLHVPLIDQTRRMIGEKEIALMKPTAIIINTARGGLIDEKALLTALREGRIYAAGLDAFEHEPPDDKGWFELDNVVLGSHCAASTAGATRQMGRMATENLLNDLAEE